MLKSSQKFNFVIFLIFFYYLEVMFFYFFNSVQKISRAVNELSIYSTCMGREQQIRVIKSYDFHIFVQKNNIRRKEKHGI